MIPHRGTMKAEAPRLGFQAGPGARTGEREMAYSTTLNEIRRHSPCQDGWEKLLRHLGKLTADDQPLKITTIF